MLFDPNTEFGARVARRLQTERIIWLTTVRPDGSPQPTPVWFVWDSEAFLIYSRPGQRKLHNIASNPRVSLHFDSDGRGGDIVVFSGRATIESGLPPANQVAAYAEKYQPGFLRIGMTVESFAQAYSVPIRVKPVGVRGH